MTISFDNIPVTYQLPGVLIEISTAQANNRLVPLARDILLVGQKYEDAPASLDVTQITSAAQAAEMFGDGSELHLMAEAAFENHPFGRFYCLPFGDPENGVANVTTITLTQEGGASGEVIITIAGKSIKAVIGGTLAQTATNLKDAINAVSVPFTAESAAGVVTLTCNHKGGIGNWIPVLVGYYDALPDGITTEMEVETVGGGDLGPTDRESVDGLLGDQWFLSVAIPTHINVKPFLDEAENRNEGTRQIPSQIFQCAVDPFDSARELGTFTNSGLHAITALGKSSPYYDGAVAAAIAASASFHLENDPARPLQNIEIKGVTAPKATDQFTDSERNLLLQDGVGTVRFGNTGKVFFERMRTTYTEDDTGAESSVLGDVEDVATLIFLRWSLVRHLLLTYPRYKIANDEDTIVPYANITKPSLIKASIMALAEQWRAAGLITDIAAFQEGLVVERAPEEEDRVNLILSPKLVGQLRQIFGSLQFKL